MVDHPAARALTGYLLVRGGVHQVAYARALENLTGADLIKLFPSPRIPTEKIPECQPHIERGEHLKLYRFSPDDFQEIAAVFNGPHPETGEDLVVAEELARGRRALRPPLPAGGLRARPRARGDRRDRRAAAQGRRPAQGADRRRRQQRRQRRQEEEGQGRLTLASWGGGDARLPTSSRSCVSGATGIRRSRASTPA